MFDAMRNADIGVNVHYIPIHLQPFYQSMGFKVGDFPNAERYYDSCLTLPLHPELKPTQQTYIIENPARHFIATLLKLSQAPQSVETDCQVLASIFRSFKTNVFERHRRPLLHEKLPLHLATGPTLQPLPIGPGVRKISQFHFIMPQSPHLNVQGCRNIHYNALVQMTYRPLPTRCSTVFQTCKYRE